MVLLFGCGEEDSLPVLTLTCSARSGTGGSSGRVGRYGRRGGPVHGRCDTMKDRRPIDCSQRVHGPTLRLLLLLIMVVMILVMLRITNTASSSRR